MPPRKYEGDFAERKRQSALAWKAKDPEHARQVYAAASSRRKQDDPVYVFFYWLKTRAKSQDKKKYLGFNLTLEYVRELMVPMTCSQTGHKLAWDWAGEGPNPWAPSIDRIDSGLPYIVGNVQVVSWIYNRCKGEWPDEIVRQFRAPPKE